MLNCNPQQFIWLLGKFGQCQLADKQLPSLHCERLSRITELNVHAVAAVLAGVSGLAMLADKPAWAAVYVVAGVAIEPLAVIRR